MNLRQYAAQQTKGTQGTTEATTGTAAPISTTAPENTAQQPLPDKYKRIYRTVFDFHARHIPAPCTPEEWDECAADLQRTSEAVNDDPFAVDLLIAAFNELERIDIARAKQN